MRFIRKTNYYQDIQLFKHGGQIFWYATLLFFLLFTPLFLSDFYLGELTLVFIYGIAGVGLMLLTGYTGQVSLGHAAFLGIGAYCHAYLLSHEVPFLISLTFSSLFSGATTTRRRERSECTARPATSQAPRQGSTSLQSCP